MRFEKRFISEGSPEMVEVERRAAEGDVDAMVALGSASEARRDLVAARAWFEKGALLGDSSAMNALGCLDSSADDMKSAVAWWKKSAAMGDAQAMFLLASFLRTRKSQRVWLERAAEAGHEQAMSNFGSALVRAGESEAGKAWLERSAALGNAFAMSELGDLNRASGDLTAALAWYEGAAGASPLFVDSLTDFLEETGDRKGARAVHEAAAEHGSEASAGAGAWMAYEDEDVDSMVQFLELAGADASSDHFERLEVYGRSTDAAVRRKARVALKAAADADSPGAMCSLGILAREDGRIDAARHWLEMASEREDDRAVVALEELDVLGDFGESSDNDEFDGTPAW
jgi:TPR repeat protein